MLTDKKIGFLGAGNLAEALIKGLLASGSVTAAQITASDRFSPRLVHIAENYEVRVVNDNTEAARGADIVFLTVKPTDAPQVLAEVAPGLGPGKLLISVAAGLTTERILDALSKGQAGVSAGSSANLPAVVRAMPNTPALIGEGMTALYAGHDAGAGEIDIARAVFKAVGRVVVVEDESLMDAVTGLSGSGPAYVFLFMESLVDAGTKCGLPEADSLTLALQTTIGAALLAGGSEKSLAELREMVSSPGGTTIEGLKKLREGCFPETVIAAVEAASKRSRELSEG
jgi:pyrroline-5-carboxylate reductase